MVETIFNDREHDRELVKVSSKEDFVDIYEDEKELQIGGIADNFEFEDYCDWDGTLPAYFEVEDCGDHDNAEQVSDPKKWANDIADYYEKISKEYRAFADSLN